MYHPGTGRFVSEDPLGFQAGDSNLYRYVQNSPPNYTDPMGQRGVPVVVPEVPPAPLPVAPAQPAPSPRIPGLGVLGGAAFILLQDLLFPRPAGFGEDEFLEQLNCLEENSTQNWPKRCKLQSSTLQLPLNRRICVYRCKDPNGRLERWNIPAYIPINEPCPEYMDWIDRGAGEDGLDIIR